MLKIYVHSQRDCASRYEHVFEHDKLRHGKGLLTSAVQCNKSKKQKSFQDIQSCA